jgi:cell fate regulator YaaT (PSP1 superfamily)
MRQIGSRDEARLLGDIESCGQECCCIRFLKALKPVNMRMAKMQKATLDPSKISGYCGRLKCCLRYEDKTYTELKNRLPRKNTIVRTTHGQGKVVDTQILTQLVMIEQDDGTKIAVPVEELEIISLPSVEAIEKEEQSDATGSEGQDGTEDKKQ